MNRHRAESEGQSAWYVGFDALLALADDDPVRALAVAERLEQDSPGANPWLWYHFRTIHAFATLLAGDPAEGETLLDAQAREIQAQLDLGADHSALLWEIGAIHAALGRPAQALDFAERARAAGFQSAQPFFAEFDPMMDSVRDDPRFQAMVEDSRQDFAEMRRRVELEEIQTGER
jgi:hypothetical protein